MIYQRELNRFKQDSEGAKALESKVALKKTELIGRLKAHEEIEEGPLAAQLHQTSSRRFSAEGLLAAGMSAEQIARLKEKLPESVSTSLKVVVTATAPSDEAA